MIPACPPIQSPVVERQTVYAASEVHASNLSVLATRREWAEARCQLAEWLSDPSKISNEEGEAPSKMMLRIAQATAISLENAQMPAPTAICPDGNGGIAFEWRFGEISQSVEVSPIGDVETIVIQNGRISLRAKYIPTFDPTSNRF
jgi:hypothetical protein